MGTGEHHQDDDTPLPLRTALIVDDMPSFRLLLKGMLQAIGVRVIGEANSGEDAVALCEQCKPDIVFLDLHMPKGDGLSALRRIKHIAPRTRVVVATSSAEAETVRTVIASGADSYLVKPFSGGRVLAELRYLCRAPARAGE